MFTMQKTMDKGDKIRVVKKWLGDIISYTSLHRSFVCPYSNKYCDEIVPCNICSKLRRDRLSRMPLYILNKYPEDRKMIEMNNVYVIKCEKCKHIFEAYADIEKARMAEKELLDLWSCIFCKKLVCTKCCYDIYIRGIWRAVICKECSEKHTVEDVINEERKIFGGILGDR